ncbi:MAG: TIGR03790 family protein [Gemmataceae bacterium]|nr:TIGR03790 family protein [Gemmataceae bacterium]MDW8264534.1 TIGR03790 family protein [Gemmataceae bacterium]
MNPFGVRRTHWLGWLVASCFGTVFPTPASALGPADVFIVVNRNVPASREVAEHYCRQRGVPLEQIIALDLPTGEDISRADYERRLAAPLRAALFFQRDRAKVLLVVYGVPLRVGPPPNTPEEEAELARIRPELGRLRTVLRELQDLIAALESEAPEDPPGNLARTLQERRREREALEGRLRQLENHHHHLSHADSRACVDSELSLLWWGTYSLRLWQHNLDYFQVPEQLRAKAPQRLMVSRLDGPTPELAKRLVDDAIAAEKTGLKGKVYVDARGIRFDPRKDTGFGYGGYDESLREMARLLERDAKLPVVLDDQPALFAPDSCPDCALYCGWYSLARYVDCCRFVRGAVAYHIASAEAVSLRNPQATYWCKNLLEKGACATLGPVAEPYTIGFPKPAEFFGLLVTGRYTLVECYHRTVLLSSWMTVLVGDPLYNPFAREPRLRPEQVKPSPAGGRFLVVPSGG